MTRVDRFDGEGMSILIRESQKGDKENQFYQKRMLERKRDFVLINGRYDLMDKAISDRGITMGTAGVIKSKGESLNPLYHSA